MAGKPLVVRNISKIKEVFDVKTIRIPKQFSAALDLVQKNFPAIGVEEYNDDGYSLHFAQRHNGAPLTQGKDGELEIPINSIITKAFEKSLSVNQIIYPWDFLKAMQLVLEQEITEQIISPDASVAKTAIINGPCLIEDNVTVDDFCKIKGPIYIGKGSFIGMGSLVRNCMIGENTRIGFNCEVAKTYFAGNDKTSHQNVILDSIIGKGVWFGGYSGTANVLLTQKNVKYQVEGELIDTGMNHFGAVVGNNSAIGAAVIIFPGRQVKPNSSIQAGTIVRK